MGVKKYKNQNVYDAAMGRIKIAFSEFDNVLVSFSGGKDSGVMMEMCYDYAKENDLLHKLCMVHLDYEAQYQMTTDYVDDSFKRFFDIRRFWLCMPIYAQCACNMQGGYWIPWEKSKKSIWVREMPAYSYVINEDNAEFKISATDDEVPADFFRWFTEKYGSTASLIGLRAQESLDRFRVAARNDMNRYNGHKFTCVDKYVTKFYPMYDWTTDDIWVYYAKTGKPYNKLYDLFYQAGLTIHQMRVASPFNDCAGAVLKYYQVIDPKNWGRMIGRVNGVNFMNIYGGTTAMGWKNITKPANFTWKQYCEFLLNTLDEETAKHYREKLETSIKFWRETGGSLSDDIIRELKAENAPAIYTGETNKRSSKEVVKFNDYMDDTNVTDFRLIPTYKRMCVCIMKNDYCCKYMGFGQTKKEIEKRKNAAAKYAEIL